MSCWSARPLVRSSARPLVRSSARPLVRSSARPLVRSSILRPSIAVACAGLIVGAVGCRLNQQERLDLIISEAGHAENLAGRALKRQLRRCRGEQTCIDDAYAEYATAMQHLQAMRDARINGELEHARAAEKAWEDWLRSLPEASRKLWEGVGSVIEKLKNKEVKSDGLLDTNSIRVLTSDAGAGGSGTDNPEPLTPQDAAALAVSMMSSPDSWEEVFRLRISGGVGYEISGDTGITPTTGVFALQGIYDGVINPGDSIGLTSGTVTLFDGELTVRVSPVVGASHLRIFDNGNGFLRITGYTDHADEWNDTDSGDLVSLEIPVTLEGQSLRVSSGGVFTPGHMLLARPRDLIADHNIDGLVNGFDLSDLLTDFNAGDDYADLNEDGVVDQSDMDYFMSEYQDVIDWNQFRTDWRTAP